MSISFEINRVDILSYPAYENVTCFPIVFDRTIIPDWDLQYWAHKHALYHPIITPHACGVMAS